MAKVATPRSAGKVTTKPTPPAVATGCYRHRRTLVGHVHIHSADGSGFIREPG
jgi:hypothetical protein